MLEESAIGVLEGFLGMKIPDGYRVFLLDGNGQWQGGQRF